MEAVYQNIDKVFVELSKRIKVTVPDCICEKEADICTCECKETTHGVRKLVRLRKLLRGMLTILNKYKAISGKLEMKTKI